MDETPIPAGGDDYSYDLAHEAPPAGDRPAPRARRAEEPGTATHPDEVGDYSYDLAHEVPPARRDDG